MIDDRAVHRPQDPIGDVGRSGDLEKVPAGACQDAENSTGLRGALATLYSLDQFCNDDCPMQDEVSANECRQILSLACGAGLS
jgi:hypothetical protein